MESLRFVLVGHPVSHSISPALHRAAYAALELPHSYEVVDCTTEATLAAVVRGIGAGAIAGANVTLPWKRRALELASKADARARETGAANVLSRSAAGQVVAHNTDVTALTHELGRLAPLAKRALVIGAGGAALAALAALRALGIDDIGVTARRFRPEVELGAVTRLSWPSEGESQRVELESFAARAELLVQATSAGMRGGDPGELVSSIIPWSRLRSRAVAYDVVYTPAETPFLRAAAQRGLRSEGGLGMLLLQAAHAIEIWIGQSVSVAVLKEAAERALSEAERGQGRE